MSESGQDQCETKESSGGEIFDLDTSVDSEKNTTKRENCLNGDEKQSESEESMENKRQRPTNSNSVPVLGISPPNFISFEEIMKTANDISRLALVNEIVLNENFKLEKKDEASSLEKSVRENMQKAFWDILSEQLAESPPNYKQAISVIQEIKENLLSLLLPQHTQLKNEITEILDLDLIKQKAENGIFDFQRYAQYVLSVCSRLCCPARDEMIRKLTQTSDIVTLAQGIFDLLETMKLDFANFYIQQFRPHIKLASVEYERDKFKQLIESHQKYNIDVLEFTAKWLKRNFESLDLSSESEAKNIFNKILISSYIEPLKCLAPLFNCYLNNDETEKDDAGPVEDDYPETLLLIRKRIDTIRESIFQIILISSVFVVTFAAIGEPLQSIKEFRAKLKSQLIAIVSSAEDNPFKMQCIKFEELRSMLTSISLQVNKSINEAYEQYKVTSSEASEKKLESLKYQITELATPGNRICSVMERRILEFIERVISSSTAVPIQVPSGLSSFSKELTQIGGDYTRLVSYNRAVYSVYYMKIISQITASTHMISPNELKAIEKSLFS